ncbi:MAG: Replicative DNA helicase [candidate division TM6 bacterium GW2011_GWE2_36_25]|nr:MAG: Replicative DNA helicase [candidate division TM6 bacterium GW2011_GWF2_36_131]KKQ03206.1 MAG: Replicative DNA helicase [candidate division TM6 bacterium GW2011_GWE2_36_25]KKQ19008.1 MAG: Replicative DNA helicase [candidate division TM6 bacterium GW2011_GWA2_36_9]
MQRMSARESSTERTFLGKNLPANLDAERAVLGAVLLNDQTYMQAAEILRAEDFYHPANKAIFEVMTHLVSSMKRIDLVTLQDELSKRMLLDSIGGALYLVSLQEEIPEIGLVEQHAKIIKEKAILRELISSATSIIQHCFEQKDDDIFAVIDQAEKIIFEVSQKRSSQSFVQLDIWLKRTFKHLSDVKSHSKGITGIPTGFTQLDTMSSGLQKGDLIILAARPSMGKTSLALNIGLNSALENFSVGLFSLEMPAEQLILRILSSEAGIPHQKIRNATISSEEWVELTNAAARLAELKLFIDDSAGISIVDLRTRARKIKAEHNVDLFVIDYLQLLHSTKWHENRHQEVSEISRSLKALAKELGVPILALSQLSRAVEGRVDKRPMMSDLRESGALEQDADVIMFLYRDIIYNPETENPGLAELIIGKQRNGPTGTVFLNFERELTKFENGDFDY